MTIAIAPMAIKTVERVLDRDLTAFNADFRHPSLQVKKYGGFEDVWQARVDDSVRFYK